MVATLTPQAMESMKRMPPPRAAWPAAGPPLCAPATTDPSRPSEVTLFTIADDPIVGRSTQNKSCEPLSNHLCVDRPRKRRYGMAGRPREFDRDEALAKARDSFWAHGYEGTSISDLVGALGL